MVFMQQCIKDKVKLINIKGHLCYDGKNDKKDILDSAIKHNVNIYSFDVLDNYYFDKKSTLNMAIISGIL